MSRNFLREMLRNFLSSVTPESSMFSMLKLSYSTFPYKRGEIDVKKEGIWGRFRKHISYSYISNGRWRYDR